MRELEFKTQIERVEKIISRPLSSEEFKLAYEKLGGFDQGILKVAIDSVIVEAKKPTIALLQKLCFEFLRIERKENERRESRNKSVADLEPDWSIVPKFNSAIEAINWVEGFRVKCVDALKAEKRENFFKAAEKLFPGECEVCVSYKKTLKNSPDNWQALAKEYATLSSRIIVKTCMRLAIDDITFSMRNSR